DVRQQAIAGFDVAPANGFLLRAVVPHLVGLRAFRGVITKEGREGCKLNPTREQRGCGRTAEPAHIRADKRDSADAEIEHHLRRQAEMVPGCGIISSPGKSVALASRISRASED